MLFAHEDSGGDGLNLEEHLFGNLVNLNSEVEVILDLSVDIRSLPSQHGFTRTLFWSFLLQRITA